MCTTVRKGWQVLRWSRNRTPTVGPPISVFIDGSFEYFTSVCVIPLINSPPPLLAGSPPVILCLNFSCHACYVFCPYHGPWSDGPDIFWRLQTVPFSSHCCYFPCLTSKYLKQSLIRRNYWTFTIISTPVKCNNHSPHGVGLLKQPVFPQPH